MATTMAQELQELADDFDFLEDWKTLSAHPGPGKELTPLSAAEHSEDHKVRGCASQSGGQRPAPEGRLAFRGDSDAHWCVG